MTGRKRARRTGSGRNAGRDAGRDVDLDREEVRLPDGTRLTREVAEQIVTDVHRKTGRPSLTGEAAISPRVSFRLTPETRDRAAALAAREGKTLSQLARDALEAHIRAAS